MNNQIKTLIFGVIFIIGGLIFVIMGLKSNSEIKNFPEVQVTVAGVEVNYTTEGDGTQTREETVWVNYTVDGVEYDEILNAAPGNLKQGDTLIAHYNPEKPSYVNGSTAKSNLIPILFGVFFMLAGIATTVLKLLRGR